MLARSVLISACKAGLARSAQIWVLGWAGMILPRHRCFPAPSTPDVVPRLRQRDRDVGSRGCGRVLRLSGQERCLSKVPAQLHAADSWRGQAGVPARIVKRLHYLFWQLHGCCRGRPGLCSASASRKGHRRGVFQDNCCSDDAPLAMLCSAQPSPPG